MAFRIKRRESVRQAIRRIAMEQLCELTRLASNDDLDVQESVHELRKTCKRMRALIRLVQGHLGKEYRVENCFYRELAKRFAPSRDAQVQWQMFQTLSAAAIQTQRLAPTDLETMGRFLAACRERAFQTDEQLRAELHRIVPEIEAARSRVVDWKIPRGGFSVLRIGLEEQYRTGRRAMKRAFAQRTDETFHDWRKAVKYHGYHATLLRRIAPRLMQAHRDLVDELGERLGVDHDESELAKTLRSGVQTGELGTVAESVDRFLKFLATQRREGRRFAWRIGRQVFAERPGALVGRWRSYWKSWRQGPG